MRKVCRLAREVLDIAAREIKPGVTTDHIDKAVHEACIERNVRCRYPTHSPLFFCDLQELTGGKYICSPTLRP